MKLWLSPHDDDAELFGAFTLIRERPLVVICLDSYVQADRGLPITATQRASETFGAMECLFESQCGAYDSDLGGWPGLTRLEIRDNLLSGHEMRSGLIDGLAKIAVTEAVEHVYAPAIERGGHMHHNLVGVIADELWPGHVTHYLTYTDRGKTTDGIEVLPDDGEWIARKLRALACHRSQMTMDPRCGCWPHFLGGLREYYQR